MGCKGIAKLPEFLPKVFDFSQLRFAKERFQFREHQGHAARNRSLACRPPRDHASASCSFYTMFRRGKRTFRRRRPLETFSILHVVRQHRRDVVRRHGASFFPSDFQSLQKIMKRRDGHLNCVGQLRMKFFERRVGMFGDQLSHFFFVRLKFWALAALVFFWRDATRFATLLAKRIHPRNADRIFSRRVLARHAAVAIVQNTFPQNRQYARAINPSVNQMPKNQNNAVDQITPLTSLTPLYSRLDFNTL